MVHRSDNWTDNYYHINSDKIVTPLIITLGSPDGDTATEFRVFLVSSSDAQSEHMNFSNFFASSIVIPIQEGWNLQS